MKTRPTFTGRHNRGESDMQEDNHGTLPESSSPQPTTMKEAIQSSSRSSIKSSLPGRPRLLDESTTTSVEPYLYAEISMSEYRILNPQTAEIPTLTQSRLLAAVLERQRLKAIRRAARQARLERFMRTMKAAVHHPWQAVVTAFHHLHEPVLLRTTAAGQPRQGATLGHRHA